MMLCLRTVNLDRNRGKGIEFWQRSVRFNQKSALFVRNINNGEAMGRWTTADDSKLATLFSTPRNGVDPKDLSVEAVKAVHKKYFPQSNYRNFAPLYRAKARDFQVGKTLEGHRASKSFDIFDFFFSSSDFLLSRQKRPPQAATKRQKTTKTTTKTTRISRPKTKKTLTSVQTRTQTKKKQTTTTKKKKKTTPRCLPNANLP